ncbi:MAG: sterol desaturase family protein [Betaproteobacteria bacterium]|nr:sterol desaturase family protein [Betaproteobacteria bacterium]
MNKAIDKTPFPALQLSTGADWLKVLFYPMALLVTLVFILAEVGGVLGTLGKAYPVYLFSLIAVMVGLERWMPARPQWNMTRESFLVRDLPMLVVNGAAISATTFAVTWIAQRIGSASFAPAHGLPWWGEAVAAILISDFCWYWLHRYSHEGKGPLGRWLWKVHVLHHLPDRVYVFMHVAAHPINSALVRVILMLPSLALGFSPEGVFAASVFNGFQGLVSHFNFDASAGWFNTLFMGTELHRYHHSADPQEAKNYAAVVTIWDQLFDTFEHHPGRLPEELGVRDRESYPNDRQWLRLLALPFRVSRGGASRTASPHEQ